MRFVTIRQKLILRVSLILGLSFLAVISLVSYMSVTEFGQLLEENKIKIEHDLIDKGKTLTRNNSEALKGMVEDNAFFSMQALISSTVQSDADILFGTYMDTHNNPWVQVTPDNPSGTRMQRGPLEDENTQWVSGLRRLEIKHTTIDHAEVLLVAAPVIVDGEILGFIQYGLSTQHLKNAIAQAQFKSEQSLIKTLTLLFFVGLLAALVSFFAVKAMAEHITRPINDLTQSAASISRGDYDTNVKIDSNDEIGLLALNLDDMRLRIQKKINDLGELNALGQSLSVIEREKDVFNIAVINSHFHSNASFSTCYVQQSNGRKRCLCEHPESGNTESWSKAIEDFLSTQPLDHNISQHPIIVAEIEQTLIKVPFIAGENNLATMFLCGPNTKISFSDSDDEYYQSLAQMVLVSQRNIRLKNKIHKQNANLESTVRERTASLQEKTNDIHSMMQNMHQGLFTISENGAIHQEYAEYLENIFETKNIAGLNAVDFLFQHATLGSDVQNQVSTVIQMLIGCDEIMFDFNSHLLVKDFKINIGKTEKQLELEWAPIALNNDISKIMVTVRDVTALKALQGEAAEQKQELEIIGQILALEKNKFNNFVSSAFEFIEKNQSIIETSPDKSNISVIELFRNMHTIKGNARTYGLSYITDSVHIAENSYDELRKNKDKRFNKPILLKELADVRRGIRRYCHINDKILTRDNKIASTKNSVIESNIINEIQSSIDSINIEQLEKQDKKKMMMLKNKLILINTSSLNTVLEDVCRSTKSLASELGKPEPDIEINARGISIKNCASPLLNNVFMHNFRNALDHGIEPPELRTNKGKDPRGKITLNACVKNRKLELRLKDDGQGIALKEIRKKAILDGLISQEDIISNHDLAQLIFHSGISTAEHVNTISGRGVGMDAVKSFIENEGGNIDINLNNDNDNQSNVALDFAPFELVITLPENTFLQQASS